MIPKTTRQHEASHLWAAAQSSVPILKLIFQQNGVGKVTVNDFEDLAHASAKEIVDRFKNIYVLTAVGLYCDIRTGTTNVRSADDERALDAAVTGLIQRLPLQEILQTDLFRTLERKSEDFVQDNWGAIEHLAEHFDRYTYDQNEIAALLAETRRWLESKQT